MTFDPPARDVEVGRAPSSRSPPATKEKAVIERMAITTETATDGERLLSNGTRKAVRTPTLWPSLTGVAPYRDTPPRVGLASVWHRLSRSQPGATCASAAPLAKPIGSIRSGARECTTKTRPEIGPFVRRPTERKSCRLSPQRAVRP